MSDEEESGCTISDAEHEPSANGTTGAPCYMPDLAAVHLLSVCLSVMLKMLTNGRTVWCCCWRLTGQVCVCVCAPNVYHHAPTHSYHVSASAARLIGMHTSET